MQTSMMLKQSCRMGVALSLSIRKLFDLLIVFPNCSPPKFGSVEKKQHLEQERVNIAFRWIYAPTTKSIFSRIKLFAEVVDQQVDVSG